MWFIMLPVSIAATASAGTGAAALELESGTAQAPSSGTAAIAKERIVRSMDAGVRRMRVGRIMLEDTRGGYAMNAATARRADGQPVGTYARIYAVVRRIPRGKVANYGLVARLAGLPGRARQVGYAMYALPPGSRVPWQRVINARGTVSRRRVPGAELTQRMLLEKEGVRFGPGGRISFDRYGWLS
jgi:methylated-DNA-protein-cysteine methyltransferase-like protein